MKITNPVLIKLSGLFKVDSDTEFNSYVDIELNDLLTSTVDQFILRKIDVTEDKNTHNIEVIFVSAEQIIELFGLTDVLSNFANDDILNIVKNEPNDQALGFKIRKQFLG